MFLSRRRLLIDGLSVTALVPALGGLPRACRRSADPRVLVVVQLTGGNDGLNTVVPHRQDAYYRLRPTLALKRSSLVPLDSDHGLHPALAALEPAVDEGRVTVIQGVGYERPDRSHFRSLEIWHTADPTGPPRGIGWLGRMADQLVAAGAGVMPALLVGDEDLPLALHGRRVFAPALRDENSLHLAELPGLEPERTRLIDAVDAGNEADADAAFLRASARAAYAASARLEGMTTATSRADYPALDLARKLRLIASLVAGRFDTRLFFVSLGGFDTHARQAASQAALLEELARSLAAFERDLAAHGVERRVATLIYSEFGRRAEENASRGTDHGAAAPVLLLGGPGAGGLRGSPPALESLVDGDVGCSVDFRGIYSALEHEWMGLEPSSAIPAFDFAG